MVPLVTAAVSSSVVRWFRHASRAVVDARELGLVTHVLALAAQQVLCTAPLLIATSEVLRRLGREGPGQLFPRYLGLDGKAAADVAALFSGASSKVGLGELVVGLALSFLFGVGAGATLQRGFEVVWGLGPAGLRSVVRQVQWLLGLLVYGAIVLGVGQGAHRIHGHDHLRLLARAPLQLVASFVFFWWSQHLLLAGRISWRRLSPGSIGIAVGTALLVVLSGVVLPGQITDEVHDYGLIGAAFVLSVWLVTLSSVVLGGAYVGMLIDRVRADAVTSAP